MPHLLTVEANESEVTLQFRQEGGAKCQVQLTNNLGGLHKTQRHQQSICSGQVLSELAAKAKQSGATVLTLSGAASFIWFNVGVTSC